MAKQKRLPPVEPQFTPLPPDQAAAYLTQVLTMHGATVLTQTERSITGEMRIRRNPSCLVASLLFLLLVVPGIVYLVVAGKDIQDPFSIQLIPEGQGTRAHAAGRGHGLNAALRAIQRLPR
jgi:hypothetical protein